MEVSQRSRRGRAESPNQIPGTRTISPRSRYASVDQIPPAGRFSASGVHAIYRTLTTSSLPGG